MSDKPNSKGYFVSMAAKASDAPVEIKKETKKGDESEVHENPTRLNKD